MDSEHSVAVFYDFELGGVYLSREILEFSTRFSPEEAHLCTWSDLRLLNNGILYKMPPCDNRDAHWALLSNLVSKF